MSDQLTDGYRLTPLEIALVERLDAVERAVGVKRIFQSEVLMHLARREGIPIENGLVLESDGVLRSAP